MRITRYLYDRIVFLLINFLLFLMCAFTLGLGSLGYNIIFLVFVIWFTPLISYISLEYFKFRKYCNELQSTVDMLDKKYLVSQVIKKPSFIEGEILHDVLSVCNKAMNDFVRKYKLQNEEYRDYIEAWVHEIKTPIASTKLIIGNNKSEITKKIEREVNKISAFVEQVLYYSRSNDVSRDYIIKKVNLKTIINNVVRKKARDFYNKKVKLILEELDYDVIVDEKWIEFIINQILQNSLKYSKKTDGIIKISARDSHNGVEILIHDNGYGIPENDLGRVFEKGFTGANGRRFSKSTGMGLYICKKICSGLKVGINIESKENVFTNVRLKIPHGGTGKFD